MNREQALNYIEIVAENWLKDRMKYAVEQSHPLEAIKSEVEYYEKTMEYIRENLK